MRRVYEVCRPRVEVLEGTLIEDIFAAELTPVVTAEAPRVYSHAPTFFANTFPTEGLRALIREVFLRLSGKGGNSLIRLETTFGGGKTHALIALYHLARDPSVASPELADRLEAVSQPVRVAGIVGRDFGTEGHDHDGTRVYTLWGELAWQLGGKEAYAFVAEVDRQFIAPSGDMMRQVLGEGPVLVMIDELGHYVRRAQGKKLAGVGTLADQIPPFLQSLAAAASVQPQAAVVLTLTGSEDAYAEENERIRGALAEVSKVAARQELVLEPTRDEEVAHVVVRRLFEEVSAEAAEETAEAYHRYYVEAEDKQAADFPPRATRPEYRSEIVRTYPFHPELLRVLTTKVASIPQFQRTRGALRLLARIVRSVWQHREDDAWLIHPFHVDFADEETRMDLTSRLGVDHAGFGPPIEADIYSADGDSHAQELDRDWVARGRPSLATRLARTIYLHSLAHGPAARAEVPDLLLACAQPGLDPELLREALQGLENTCWYLDHDERAYWFTKEAQLNKVLDEQREQVTIAEAKNEVRKRLRAVYQGTFLSSVFFPEGPGDVSDDADRIKLCVMDFDAFTFPSGEGVPAQVRHIYERSGASEGFRRFKNALLFLLADPGQLGKMIDTIRMHMALQRIIGTPELLSQLSQTSQQEARTRAQKTEVEVRVAITRAYRHLLVPNPEAADDESGLQHVPLDVEKAARVESESAPARGGGQQKVIQDALAAVGKMVLPAGPAPAPDLVLEMAWPHGQQSMTCDDLVKAFRSQPRLPMLIEIHCLRATVCRGVEEAKWVYFDGARIWTKTTGAPVEADVRLDAEHELWTISEAQARGFCLKCGYKPCRCAPPPAPPEPSQCPRCGKLLAECECPPCPRCGNKPWQCSCQPALVFESSDTLPQKAFTELADWAAEKGVTAIERLEIVCYNRLTDLREVWVGVQYLVPPEQAAVDFNASIQLAALRQAGEAADVQRGFITCSYQGPGTHFRRVYEFFDGISRGAEGVSYTASFHVALPQPLSPESAEIQELRKRLVDSGVEKVKLRAPGSRPSSAG